jgi:hypothetical protein
LCARSARLSWEPGNGDGSDPEMNQIKDEDGRRRGAEVMTRPVISAQGLDAASQHLGQARRFQVGKPGAQRSAVQSVVVEAREVPAGWVGGLCDAVIRTGSSPSQSKSVQAKTSQAAEGTDWSEHRPSTPTDGLNGESVQGCYFVRAQQRNEKDSPSLGLFRTPKGWPAEHEALAGDTTGIKTDSTARHGGRAKEATAAAAVGDFWRRGLAGGRWVGE